MVNAFKDVLYSISASVAAGHQMPHAIEDAADQARMFGNCLADELDYIVFMYKDMHADIEDLLCSLSERTHIDEIDLFSSSYGICKKSGGDLEKICLRSAYLLIERIDYQNEVAAILSEKKLDTIIMMAMPLIILLFLNMSSYDYVAVLYESSEGRIVMSICLLLMITACLWSLKIMKLEL